jgi:hypothetical protein
LIVALGLAQLVAAQPGAVFAPPLDVPLHVVTETVRTDRGVVRRFASGRTIVFHRDGDGFRAAVTIDRDAQAPDDDDPGAMFSAAMAKMAGRTIVLRLDSAGKVRSIDDQAAAWQAMVDGIAALAPAGGDAISRQRAGRIRAVVAAVRQMPVDRQLLTLGTLVSAVIAAEVATEGAGPPRPVRVPGQSVFGAAQLDGFRVVRVDRGMLEVRVTAEGAVSMRGPDGAVEGRMSLETVRRVDPATGLVMASQETLMSRSADGSLSANRVATARIER